MPISLPNAPNSPRAAGQHGGLHLQKEGVLGLVKGNWAQLTTQGKEYYEYMHLAEHACFILRMRLGPLANDKVKVNDYNDPQHIYAMRNCAGV